MVVSTSPDEHTTTAALQARLAQVERTLARYEAERGARRSTPKRCVRRRGWWAGAAAALLIALVPLSLLGAGPTFSDLSTAGAEHQADIQAIGAVGITTGFADPKSTDPNQRLYDPKGTVTREQMASFLARTAGLGANPPITNAATALKLATNPTSEATFAANDLIRIAALNYNSQKTDYYLLPSAPPSRDIETLTLEVSTQSYVLFQFTGHMIAETGTGRSSLQSKVRMDNGTKQLLTVANLGVDPGETYPDNLDRQPVAGSYVFVVAPGIHTFTLSIDRLSGSSTRIGLAAPAMQAIAFPFGSSGEGAAKLPEATSGDGNASSTSQP